MPKKKKILEFYYYDACALEGEKAFSEIINKRTTAILSHLSLGEAYGSCLSKGKDKSDSFLNLIDKINSKIKIVGNDNINGEFNSVIKEMPRLSITDAIHVATAIKYKCRTLRTLDRDLTRIDKKKISELGTKYNTPGFSISSIS